MLIPCPYCSSTHLSVVAWPPESTIPHKYNYQFCVWCLSCHASGPLGNTEDIASELWNECEKVLTVTEVEPGTSTEDLIENPEIKAWAKHLRRKERVVITLGTFLILSYFGWVGWLFVQIIK